MSPGQALVPICQNTSYPFQSVFVRFGSVRSNFLGTLRTHCLNIYQFEIIKRSFRVRDKDVISQLYKSLVRPHLEYSVQAWRPHFQKDIDFIEGVQRRATKLILDLKDKSYEERLRCQNITTLDTRRLRGDLIEVFNIFKGFENVDPIKFFELSTTPIRGHSLKIVKPRCRLDVRKYSFAHSVVDMWNSLDEGIVACDSINSFKNRLDESLYCRGFI